MNRSEMTREEAVEILTEMNEKRFGGQSESLKMAISALSKLDQIQEIINIDNSVIQEDVLKYKMVCEVMNND